MVRTKSIIALALLVVCCGATDSVGLKGGGVPADVGRVRVSEGVARVLAVKKVQPVYPDEARQKRVEGVVTMTVEISESGDVEDVVANSGDSLLVPAALEAMKQWKFKPYLLNRQPVRVETHITMPFALPAR